MATVLIHPIIYTGKRTIADGYLRFDRQIISVGSFGDFKQQDEDDIHDAKGLTIAPGFIDIHTHGGYGVDSMNADPHAISGSVDKMAQEGVTSVFLTTMTQRPNLISKSMDTIKMASENNPRILGIHLEGPFISSKYPGAQPIDYIQEMDIKKLATWYKLSGGMIKILTYVPEVGWSPHFDDYCQVHQIKTAVGHSDATYQLLKNIDIHHVTHLFNAQKGFHHREVGVVGYAMLSKTAKVELICDGIHVSPEAVQIAYKAIGPDRLELITDSMEAKGRPDGMYYLGGQPVDVHAGRAMTADGHLAGSVLKFVDAFKNIMAFTNCSIAEAVKMTSTNQAAEFHLDGKGFLENGYDADLNLFDKHLDLMATYSYGKLVNKD
ncbi:N-acetylglucosamine-6-phosphate deacetylase [Lentilactobacillus sunkii]|jgi:N-acetylglucosamine-6-phosphate deacetylase|uniref:N-acetylglucosamine-6-phosphate deacetylase n=1 Tax=Lentilactobacillus sunkii TaxID=481719 RepID=A0A1E7XCY3_9LACO|nr:N-acetylglucosamine-6-phosphate deacetylase [Lentilactobacillus sunkii]OFA10985.1 N-acetylglucosamine-6-phosphate deacetylase [Lentilactobacillus sunkii]